MADVEAAAKSAPNPQNVVSWDGPDDPLNPKNWPLRRKWLAVVVTSTFTMMSAAGASIVAPAESAIGESLHIHDDFLLQLIFSIFLLGYVVGPLFLAPLSELYGRAVVLRLSNIWFTAFTLGCAFAQNTGQMLAFRILAGIGACAPQTVGGGVLSDCFKSEERGMAIAVYTLGPVLGPSLAPMIGGFITANTTWRWCFWLLTLVGGLVQVGLWFGLPETYPPRILHIKAKKLQKAHPDMEYTSELELQNMSFAHRLGQSLVRPLILVTTQPIVQYLAVYMGLVYGTVFLMLSTFPVLWTTQYHESVEIGGLNYISLTIGMTTGAQLGGYLLDRSYRVLKTRSGSETGLPEYRVPLLFPSVFITAIGLFLYGWTAEYHVQWIAPNVGAALFGCGMIVTFTALQSYTIDSYQTYAASAIGVTAIARSLAGFGFPLFADAMYDKLGWGWGTSVIAFATLGVGVPGAAGLWFYGERLRKASPYARD